MAACPYCGVVLKRAPQRKTKCPACGESIYVRAGFGVTKARAETIDWLATLALTDADFADAERRVSEKFGRPAGHRDVLWALLNESVLRDPTGQTHKMVYFSMAQFVREEGRDPTSYLREAHTAELREWQRAFPGSKLRVRIFNMGSGSCPACAPNRDIHLSIEEALATSPIPVANCTFDIEPRSGKGWCRCTYLLDSDSF